ncbi:copper homeostasis protein CutC [Paraphoma chrysanthemicola]|uniref:Copper homeostasis protein cutC homolog n=1 Tax=Paraphoma chrysanthemicola TaxID=798071 RepID=A0A8K0R0B2_9PLEO|nr:copper homeostasis protein CutC [Paraphoma chrysanthemicola]
MLEIACFTPSSALTAARAGADRLELCASYSLGGTTPSISTLLSIRRETQIPINVMIRPRGGNFHYSAAEFEQMKLDVALFAPLASGYVFGLLDARGHVDVARNAELVDIASPLPCTFHRAIDEAVELGDEVERVVKCGFKSVLLSGGTRTAEEGVERVRSLQERYGGKLSLVLGGGVRSANVEMLKRRAGVEWVHSAAITGEGEEVDGEEVGKLKAVLDRIRGQTQNDVKNDEEMGE